jgi:hypothetical protein
MIKNYFKKYSYAWKLGLMSYLFFSLIFLLFPKPTNLLIIKTILSPAFLFLVGYAFWFVSTPLVCIAVLVFTLLRERNLNLKEKIKIMILNLICIFVLDGVIFLILVLYTVIVGTTCAVFNIQSMSCAISLTS